MRIPRAVAVAIAASAVASACSTNGGSDAGAIELDAASPDAAPPPDAGVILDASAPDAGGPTEVSVAECVQGGPGLRWVEVRKAVVIATYLTHVHGLTAGTFWIHDLGSPGGPGISVVKAASDATLFPSVGDVLTVSGRLAQRAGLLGIGTSARDGIALAISLTGAGASSPGSYPDAGDPLAAGPVGEYGHAQLDPHPESIANALRFPGPLAIDDPDAFFVTDRDGGLHPAGFEVAGGLWVSDTYVRACLADAGALDLSRGLRGVWDRYQDSYAPSSIVTVLYPLSCADLSPP